MIDKGGRMFASVPITMKWPAVTLPKQKVIVNGNDEILISWGDSISINDAKIDSFTVRGETLLKASSETIWLSRSICTMPMAINWERWDRIPLNAVKFGLEIWNRMSIITTWKFNWLIQQNPCKRSQKESNVGNNPLLLCSTVSIWTRNIKSYWLMSLMSWFITMTRKTERQRHEIQQRIDSL